MVDTPKVPASQAAQARTVLTGAEQSAKIVRLPDALQNVSRAQRLEGEVVQQNPDGSTRIRTEKGEVDIALRGRQPNPGQMLEVDVPAGRPPRQAIVRPAPQAPQQQPQQQPQQPPPTNTPPARPQPAPIQTPPPAQTAPPTQGQTPTTPPPVQTPVTRPAPAPVTPPPLPPQTQVPELPPQLARPAPLPENMPVRLMPATPAQAQALVEQTLQQLTQLPAATPARAAFTANIIVQNVQSNLLTQAVQFFTGQAQPAPLPTPAAPITTMPVPTAPLLNTPITQSMRSLLTTTSFTTPQPVLTAPIATTPVTTLPAPGITAPFQPAQAFLMPALQTTTTELTQPLLMTTTRPITPVDVSVLRIAPPPIQLSTPTGQPVLQATAAASPLLNSGAVTLTAQVSAFTPQGQPMLTLQWPGSLLPQNFILQFNPTNVALGSQVQITLPPVTPGAPASIAPQTLPSLLSLFSQSLTWPSVDEIFQSLQLAAPQLAASMARAMPSPASPANFGPAALLFIAAVRGGDMAGWLGDKRLDALSRIGKSDLLSRLTGDSRQAAQMGREPVAPGSDWRAHPLPLFWEGEVQRVMLFVKDQEQQNREDNDDGKQTRFIFDLSLTRMGDVQLDGLMREKRLDLIVRTKTPFSAPMRAHMSGLYAAAIEDVSLSGDLSFQGDPKQWVNVMEKENSFGADI